MSTVLLLIIKLRIMVVIILFICMTVIGCISTIWYILDGISIRDQIITPNVQYAILSLVFIILYLLWIIAESVYSCRKSSTNDDEQSETPKTSYPDTNTTTHGFTASREQFDTYQVINI